MEQLKFAGKYENDSGCMIIFEQIVFGRVRGDIGEDSSSSKNNGLLSKILPEEASFSMISSRLGGGSRNDEKLAAKAMERRVWTPIHTKPLGKS